MSRRINTKSLIYTMIGMLLLGILVLLAVYLPKYVMQYTDKHTEGNITEFVIKSELNKVSFSNFSEELISMGKTDLWDNKLQVVRLAEAENVFTDVELTETVNKEIDLLRKGENFPNVEVRNTDMKEHKLLSLYSEDKNNELNRVRLWKLRYVGKEYSLDLLIDAYFLKICQMRLVLNIHDDLTESEHYKISLMPSLNNLRTRTTQWWNNLLDLYYNNPKNIEIFADFYASMYKFDKVSESENSNLMQFYGIDSPNTVLMYFDIDYDYSQSSTHTISFGIWNLNKKLGFDD